MKGRVRNSTVALVVVFVGLGVLYLKVRPEPVTPAQAGYVPTSIPTTRSYLPPVLGRSRRPSPTTTAPRRTTTTHHGPTTTTFPQRGSTTTTTTTTTTGLSGTTTVRPGTTPPPTTATTAGVPATTAG